MAVSSDPLEVTGTTAQPTATRRVRRRKGANAKREQARAQSYYGQQEKNAAKALKVSRKANPVDPYKQQINSLVDEKYGPALNSAKTQAAAVPGAFDAYRAIVAQAMERQQQQYGQAVAQLGQLGGQLANGAAQVVGASQGAQAQGAAVTGATPNQGVLDDAAKAAAVRQAMVGNFGGLVTSQGTAEGAYLGNRQATSGALQLQAQTDANRGVTDLQGQIGAYKTNARNDLQTAAADAQQQQFTNQIAAQALGIKAAGEQATTTTKLRQIRATSKTAAANRRAAARSNREDNATELTKAQIKAAADAAKEARKADKEQKAANRTRRDITNRIRTLAKHTNTVDSGDTTTAGIVIPKVVHPTREQITAQLIKDGFDTVEINQAYRAMKRKRARRKKNNGGSSGPQGLPG